jgi:hypothetical protein
MNFVKAGLPIGRLRQGVPVQTKILLSLMAFCACAVPAEAAILHRHGDQPQPANGYRGNGHP